MLTYLDNYKQYLDKRNSNELTKSAYISDLNLYFDFLNKINYEPVDATEEVILNYLNGSHGSGAKISTVNRRLAALKSYYGYLKNASLIDDNPCLDVKAKRLAKKELVYLTDDEMNSVLNLEPQTAYGMRDKALLELMYSSGLKVSEVCDAKITDLNMSIGYISVKGDNAKTRVIPMSKKCKNALMDYITKERNKMLPENSDEKALFLNKLGTGITRQGIWKIIQIYGKAANLEDKLTPNNIRSSFAVHLVENGADIRCLSELLGCKSAASCEVYLSMAKNRIMEIYDKAFPRS